MDINEGTTTDDLWTPYKELLAVVEGYLGHESGGAPYAIHTFESVLRRHKQAFLCPLKNPAKNSTSREEIKKGVTEGVVLPSIGKTLLSKELVDEAIIISDMYNVNEYLALELLHSAARESSRFPGLARGLVAVLLYYDGRRALLQALKDLVMARDGVCWSINAREEIISYVSRYVQQLVGDGLVEGALDALRLLTVPETLDLLRTHRALPPHRHYHTLVRHVADTRKLLAGVVFAASAQRGLSRGLIRLIAEQTTAPTLESTGTLDEVSLALQMALLYALDLSVLHRREDGEELSKMLPLIEEPDLIPILLEKLSPSVPNVQESEGFITPASAGSGAKALCQLALGLALAALKRGPQSLTARHHLKFELLEQDEVLVDAAIDGKVFEYLDEAILSSDYVWKEEYYQKRIHILITDFIVLMHSKLMEMRVKADEAARSVQMYMSEGLVPPGGAAATRTRLDALLRCVHKLYRRDPRGLRHDYWRACALHHSHRGGGRAASLYKFVRLSGEAVRGALLARYLRALAALAVHTHTWGLLAARDTHTAHHLLHALQRYHTNLRTDPTPFSEHQNSSLGASAIVTAAARPGKLLVRQEEVEALIAALELIASVARQDEMACAQICENLQWDAVNVMFGLVRCHVPIQLKAELLRTLAALGGRPGPARRVWAALQHANLVPDDHHGLAADLQEVECRMEDYPLSRAFVSLLLALFESGGVSRCERGVRPAARHVLRRLALPAPHRPAAPAARWQLLSLCFRLFALWLDQYEPSPSDFPPIGREPDTEPPPGFELLLSLHSKSDFLRLVLTSLDEAYDLLDKHLIGQGKEFVEESLVSVLQILEQALSLERALTTAAGEAGRPGLVLGLSKLILADEGPSGADRLVTCCSVVQLGGAAAARATRLLARALRAPPAARHLLADLAHRAPRAALVRHGFVECLEAEEVGTEEHVSWVRQTKEGVVQLMLQTLSGAPPNLAHFLLGYQLVEDVSRSALHEAGVAGHPRTCLHSVLDILDHHVAAHPDSDREASNLVESCYRLVYWLCAKPSTSGPVLRYLRTRDYFLTRHVKATINLETASAVSLSARSWVVRACASEAAAAGGAAHHAALAHLLAALAHPRHHAQAWECCLLRRALEGVPVSVQPPAEPRWELFHGEPLRQALARCDLPAGTGGKRISVPKVHALLSQELASLNATAPQRNLVAIEIEKVLDYVTEVNRQRNLAATITHYYDSWRQLTEILFCVAPPDLLSLESRKNLLLNILQDLLNKIPPAEVLPQLGNLASGTVLLLLVNLRHCYIMQKRESGLGASDFETSFFGPSSQIMQTKSLTLKFILHKILSWILVSGTSTPKMRVNLYGALLNFLNIVNLKPSAADPEEEVVDTYVSRLDSSKAKPSKEESALKSMVIDVISSFGEKLCSIVCSDCIGAGHDVCRMVALSCLDTLVEIDPRTDWMNILTNQGYLRSLIDSLMQDDGGLQEALEPNPKSLRTLYVYESKMALLVKVGGSRAGAETVLALGALARLAALRALSAHPDPAAHPAHLAHLAHTAPRANLVPPASARFRQILLPALSLCSALLTSLGGSNHSCVLHVTHMLVSHVDCADTILRAAHPNSPLDLLVETEALTSVIARASDPAVLAAVAAGEMGGAEVGGAVGGVSLTSVRRLHALMMPLLSRFAAPATNEEHQTLYYEIVCNLLTFAHNVMVSEGGALMVGGALGGAGVVGAGGASLTRLVPAALRGAARLHKQQHAQAQHLRAVRALPLDDCKKLLGPECERLSPAEIRARCVSDARDRAACSARGAHRARLALQRGLHLLWRTARGLSASNAWRGNGEFSALRDELVALFNDRFLEELLEVAKNQSISDSSFLEVLVKDIKTMIQFS